MGKRSRDLTLSSAGTDLLEHSKRAGCRTYGFQGAVFASTDRQTASFQQFPSPFELPTKYTLTASTFRVILPLSFSAAEKGAPPFVRYPSIFISGPQPCSVFPLRIFTVHCSLFTAHYLF